MCAHKKLSRCLLMLMVGLWGAPAAWAQMDMGQAPVSAAQEIARINERIAILSAQLAEIELQSRIATKQAEITKLTTPQPREAMPTSPVITAEDLVDDNAPTIREISGVDGQLYATLVMGDGSVQSVRAGDQVGDWKIDQVLISGVQVKQGGKKRNLSFARDISDAGVKSTQNSMSSVPVAASPSVPTMMEMPTMIPPNPINYFEEKVAPAQMPPPPPAPMQMPMPVSQ